MSENQNPDLGAAQLNAILNSAVDGIITLDRTGRIESANRAARIMFQYTWEELQGQNVKMLMPEPYRSQHDSYMAHHLKTGENRIIGIGREVQGCKRDGTAFPLHLSVGRFEIGDEVHFTGIIRDLTATKQIELALQRAHKMEAIGQLTGGIAHDFNNLLTVVTGNLELMEMRIEDEYLRSLLNEAQEASELGARLTHRLLAFARRSPLEPEIVDLNTLVVGLTDLLHRTLGEPIELGSALSTGLWPVLADRGQVESAIVNLAVNARDAMPGGGRLFIETQNVVVDDSAIMPDMAGHAGARDLDFQPGDYVRLSIIDTGEGIPDETLDRVFEPFFTTKEVGRGTGLGLSMVYGFAKQSKGNATIYSEVGTGTTVNIYLPRHVADGQADSSARDQSPLARGAGETILVVEDDAKVRTLTVRRLSALGYLVVEAGNGPEALERIPDIEDLSLLFTDLVMPGGMSGYDLVEAARKKQPGLKVLLTSGYAEDLLNSDRLTDLEARLLRKPYRQTDLAAAIRRALGPADG